MAFKLLASFVASLKPRLRPSQNLSHACLLPASWMVSFWVGFPAGVLWGVMKPLEVVTDSAKRAFCVCSLSTRRIATNGKVKPLPAGPAPCVSPLKAVEAERLALGRKLVGWVEKQRKLSLRCSLPTYAELVLDFSSLA